MKAFFKRVGKGEKPAIPLPVQASLPDAGGLRGDDRHAQALAGRRRAYVKIKGLPTLTLRTKRPLPDGKPKTLMISRRATGYVVSMAFAVEYPALSDPMPGRHRCGCERASDPIDRRDGEAQGVRQAQGEATPQAGGKSEEGFGVQVQEDQVAVS